jgi:hypothetical protein
VKLSAGVKHVRDPRACASMFNELVRLSSDILVLYTQDIADMLRLKNIMYAGLQTL